MPKTLTLISFICFFFGTAFLVKKDKHHDRMVIDGDETIKFQVRKKRLEIKTDESLTYYWYFNNKIQSTQGGYEGELLDGEYKVLAIDNQLKESGFFKKGLKSKKWTTWFPSGKLKDVSHYNKGVLVGERRVYNEEGDLLKHLKYTKDGQIDLIKKQADKEVAKKEKQEKKRLKKEQKEKEKAAKKAEKEAAKKKAAESNKEEESPAEAK